MSEVRLHLEWIVGVTDEAALRDYVRGTVESELQPNALASAVAESASSDVMRSLIKVASDGPLRTDVPGLGAQKLEANPVT